MSVGEQWSAWETRASGLELPRVVRKRSDMATKVCRRANLVLLTLL